MDHCEFYTGKSLEFLRLIDDGQAGMYGLHTQDLVVALLVVKHRGGKVVKDIVSGERTVGLNPLMPDEESVTVVIWGMEIIYVHWGSRAGEGGERKGWATGRVDALGTRCN